MSSGLFKGRVLNVLSVEFILFIIVILSLPYSSSGTPLIRNIAKVCFFILFVYIVFKRFGDFKNDPSGNYKLRLGFDEYIVIFISTLGVILWALNLDIGIRGLRKPLLFMAVYLTISSCAKMLKVNEKLLVKILFFYLAAVFVHTIAEYIFSFPMLLNYLTGITAYHEYAMNSWNLLYTNYNFFAKNLMVGFICSLSLYFYFLTEGAENRKTAPLFILTCFFGTTILMLYSRAPILTVTVYALLLIPYYIFSNRKMLYGLIGLKKILFISTSVLIASFFLLYFDFFNALIEKTAVSGSSLRFSLWKSFIEAEMKLFPGIQFFLGHGYMNSNTDFYKIWSAVDGGHVHNNFFFIWYNYGFISMIMFIFLLIKMLISNFKIFKEVWFVYFIPLSYMSIVLFESYITRMNTRFDVIFFFIFLIFPYNMYLQRNEKKY